MHVEALRLRGFRNLHCLDLNNLSDTVIVRGANGHGKTNLLEALYLCATGRSFRRARPRDLLQHGAQQALVSGVFSHNGVRHQIDIAITAERREVRLDDRLVRQPSRLLQVINVVAFFPDDLRIAKGSPEERRHFLDRLVASHFSDFVDTALAYGLALRSRNALLRAPAPPPRDLLNVYDEQLIQHGSHLHERRVEAMQSVGPVAEAFFARIMGAPVRLDVNLSSGVAEQAGLSYAESFRLGLEKNFRRDCALHQTTCGPHRADLLLAIDRLDARTFASQGQQRAMVLALKLAEVKTVGQRFSATPILLLDDVSSELDVERNGLLFQAIDALQGQLWVSTTGATPLGLKRTGRVLEVHDGYVQTVTTSGGNI